eukprot:3789887-Pyramimonas_sp.AAC.1
MQGPSRLSQSAVDPPVYKDGALVYKDGALVCKGLRSLDGFEKGLLTIRAESRALDLAGGPAKGPAG